MREEESVRTVPGREGPGPCRRIVYLLGLMAWALAPAVHASQLISRSLPELAQGAPLIFMGRCEAVDCHWNAKHSLIFTRYRFRVLRALKGLPGPTLTLDELGGRVGDRELDAPDVPRYSRGETVLLFVHRTELGRWETFGAGQGRFEIVQDARGQPWVRNSFYRRELASMSPEGRGRAPLSLFAGHVQASLQRGVQP